MSTFRDLKERSRASLHAAMSFDAFCYTGGSTTRYKTVSARKHTTRNNNGDLAGTSLQFAEVREESPRLVFLIEDHAPDNGNVYTLETGDAYYVDHVDPVDGVTQTAICSVLSEADRANYRFPS